MWKSKTILIMWNNVQHQFYIVPLKLTLFHFSKMFWHSLGFLALKNSYEFHKISFLVSMNGYWRLLYDYTKNIII